MPGRMVLFSRRKLRLGRGCGHLEAGGWWGGGNQAASGGPEADVGSALSTTDIGQYIFPLLASMFLICTGGWWLQEQIPPLISVRPCVYINDLFHQTAHTWSLEDLLFPATWWSYNYWLHFWTTGSKWGLLIFLQFSWGRRWVGVCTGACAVGC